MLAVNANHWYVPIVCFIWYVPGTHEDSHIWCREVRVYNNVVANCPRHSRFLYQFEWDHLYLIVVKKKYSLKMFWITAKSKHEHQHGTDQSSKKERERHSPDSLMKSINFVSCWVRRNFLNIVKCCLWQISIHLSLLVYFWHIIWAYRTRIFLFITDNWDSSLQCNSYTWPGPVLDCLDWGGSKKCWWVTNCYCVECHSDDVFFCMPPSLWCQSRHKHSRFTMVTSAKL